MGSGAQPDVTISGITGYSTSQSNLNSSTFQGAIDELKGITDAIKGDAALVAYDGTASGLSATNVKTAIDEVDSDLDAVKGDATLLTYDGTTSGLNATTIKDAIDEVDGDLDAVKGDATLLTYDNSAGNVVGTTVQAGIANLGSRVTTLEDDTADRLEWRLVKEINDTSSTITLNAQSLGVSIDSLNHDYKVVVLAQTQATDTSGEFSIQFDSNSNAGRHSSVRQITQMGSSGTSILTSGEDGSAGTLINTGLTLNTGSGTQSTQTVLQAEFTVCAGLLFSDGTFADFHPYILEGTGSVIAAEAEGENTNTVSYTRLSHFTGGYIKIPPSDGGARNLTNIVLSNLPDAGLTDSVKIRVYKRER